MHSGYDYILQELGLQVTAVIEPRHGVEPTARQLAETIDRIKAADVNVLFAEKYFASKLSDTIREATGVKMYSISHISSGEYTPEKFIDEMRENSRRSPRPSTTPAKRRLALPMQGPAIEFERVNLTLGATSILEDVSFKVRPATIHCIVGANGGGKTSLVRSLLGQMPHSGSISIHWREGRVIGYVPQSLDFDKSLPITVFDFMAMTTQRRPVFLGVSRARRREIEAHARASRARRQAATRSSAACPAASANACCWRRR